MTTATPAQPAAPETPAAEPQPGTPEYNAKMAAIYEAAQGVKPAATDATATPSVPAMPEGGQEKFYDKATGVYNWGAHVVELNFQLAQAKGTKPAAAAQPAGADPAAAAAAAAQADPNAQPQAAAPAVTEADWEAAGAELVSADAKLSQATREKLEKVVPKAIVDRFEKLVQMERSVAAKTTAEYAGGAEQLNGLFEWAKTSLTAEEIAQHNAVLASANWKTAIDSLKARRAASNPLAGEPNLISGQQPSGAPAGGGPFANQADMIAAMTKRNDRGQKLYEVDPNYRAQVRQRIAASNF
jgi:hypothetical protein